MNKIRKCKDAKLFGVCCGIAKSIGIDVTLVRLSFILGTIFSGSILFWIYLVLAVIMPVDE